MNYRKIITKVTVMALIASLLLLCSVCFAGAYFEDYNGYSYPNGLNGSAGDATTWTATISNDNAVYYSTTIKFTGIGNDELKHYHVKVTMEYEGKETQPKYELVTTNLGIVPLLGKKDSSGQGYVVPDVFDTHYDTDNREVDIPVFEGEVIELNLMQESLKKGATIKVSLDSYMGETYYASPIASSIITNDLKENADTFTYKMENENFVLDEEDFENDYLTKYKKAAMGESYDAEEKGSWIEGILADIILGFGQIIQYLAELAFGLSSSGNNHLTMDNLIFNKMDCMVIDLRAVFSGGIQIGPSEIRGYFAEGNIIAGIQNVYTGLRGIAITVYIIMLLYVGVRVLLGVGTPNEAKAKKYIQYWATGVIILFLAPYFFSAIPVINNVLVEKLSSSAKVASSYTIAQILLKLGNEFAGEDAEIPAMKRELGKRIEEAKAALDGEDTEMTVDEAMAKIDEYMNQKLGSTLSDLSDEDKASFKTQYRSIAQSLYDNREDLKRSSYYRNQYETDLYNLRDFIYRNHKTVQNLDDEAVDSSYFSVARGYLEIKNATEISAADTASINNELIVIARHLQDPNNLDRTSGNIKNSAIYNNAIKTLKNILKTYYGQDSANARVNKLDTQLKAGSFFGNFFRNTYKVGSSGIKPAFDNYITAILKEELETYEGMLDALKGDPMIELERLAKENNRVIYAIAWIILLFQTFAVLFMYTKRIVVTMILICLFPIVMAMYVLDKMGDGKSQSLETWFKEFLANTTVQFFHAIIYVMIINIAIDAVRADPSRNWFILIIATCSLFPVERIMRDILGVKSTTLGQLKISAGAVIGAGVALAATGKNVARQSVAEGKHVASGVKNLKTNYNNSIAMNSLGGATASKRQAAMDAVRLSRAGNPHTLANRAAARRAAIDETTEKKRAKKQQYRDSRSANRQSLQARRNAIKENGGIKSVGDAVTVARAKAATVTGKASDITGKVRNSRVAQGALKAGHYAKYAGAELKAAGNLYKKGVGMAVGAVAGADAMANGGIAAGITSGRTTGHNVGGFKNQKKANNTKQVDSSKSPYNPQFGPISNPTGRDINGNAKLIDDSTPTSNDDLPSGGNPSGGNSEEIPHLTPESIAEAGTTGALAGAAIESAADINSGVQSDNYDSVSSRSTETVDEPTQQAGISAPEPTNINADVKTTLSENNNGEVEVTQTVDTSGTFNPADNIKEVDSKFNTQVVVEDGGVKEVGTSGTVGTTDALGNEFVELDLNEKKDE